MNKKITALLLSLTISTSFLAGCGSDSEKPELASTATNVSIYKTGESSIVSTTEYSGTISAADSVSISSKVSAKALSVLVKEGDYVKSGQVLLSLDKTDLSNSYNQAQASYNSALASYNSVVNSSVKQASAQAEQALSSAQNAYEQAKSNYDREKALFDNASNVKLAQQSYDIAKANYDREKALYDNASNVKLAQQNYDDAKNSYDRVKQLFDMGGASQVELDSAQTALVSAEENLKTVKATESAALEAAENSLISAEENLKTVKTTESAALESAEAALKNAATALENAKENINLTSLANQAAIETASASVDSARTSLNIASVNLGNAKISAPISGFVSKRNVNAGQMVSPGVELFAIANTNMVNAEINVTESVVSYLEIGGKANVKVSAAGIENAEASITAINPVKDDMTGLYNVKIGIENSDGTLKVGMLCDVELTLSQHDEIIKIPSEALINSGEEYYVYVADGNKAQKKNVTIGISDEEFTEIISGIKSGEKVIVSGKDYISDKNNEIKITGEYKK